MLTKFYYIINLKKLLQVGILTFYRASVSSPFNRTLLIAICSLSYSVSPHRQPQETGLTDGIYGEMYLFSAGGATRPICSACMEQIKKTLITQIKCVAIHLLSASFAPLRLGQSE
jgi:hypothetical protein